MCLCECKGALTAGKFHKAYAAYTHVAGDLEVRIKERTPEVLMDGPCSSRGSSSSSGRVGRRHKVLPGVGDRRNQFLDTFFVRITHSCEAQVLFGLVLLLLVFVFVERNRIPGYTSPFA